MRRVLASVAAVVGGALLIAGCSSGSSSGDGTSSGDSASAPVTVRLGLLENITHAPALIALKNGYFTKALGSAGSVSVTAYSSGTQETTAILAGQLDAAYVGPNPAINAWLKSDGKAIKIISGAADGGASFVVSKSISSAADLKGKSVATPSLGNTQDVAVRYWLKDNGIATTTTGGGQVTVKPTSPNSAAVLEFESGQIAGASEPAPYDAEMVEDGGKVLFSEPGVTTVLMVTQSFLAAHPAIVNDLLKAQIEANDLIKSDPSAAAADANAELAAYTGKPLAANLVAAAFKETTFTDNPDVTSLEQDAQQAEAVGLLSSDNLNGIFDLGPLNELLKADGQPQVGS
ncbi:MAG TPA: ABC transporter substrate-binding protein [Trebonia sp.]|nr:ABC transporter substrate-binding protein [Trebonia sp.]